MTKMRCLALAFAAILLPRQAAACDVAVVLLVDVSGSVSDADFALQRDATAAAIESPAVIAAARRGVALSALMWGAGQHHVMPWRLLRGGADARAAAQDLRAASRPERGMTDMASAIRAGLAEFRHAPCPQGRRVIDISGDGQHSGSMATLAGAVAEAAVVGVQINALPIVTPMEPDVAEWFREHVAAPTGGFVMPADWRGFGRAIRAKLATEVSSR